MDLVWPRDRLLRSIHVYTGYIIKRHLLGGVFNFLSDIVKVIPAVVGPEPGVEGCGDVAKRRRATGEVGLL